MPTLSAITAAILAGGLGTRLRDAVPDRPKPLAPVAGRPFITHLLDQLQRAGITRAVLCTGHMARTLEAALGPRHGGITLNYSAEAAPLGTGGALRHALAAITSESILVMNGDSFCDVDLGAFVASHQASGGPASIVVTSVPDAAAFGRVQVDPEGRITAFEEKDGAPSPGLINAGIYLLNRALVEAIPAARAVSLEREVFVNWVGRGLRAFRSDAPFIDIGTPQTYQAAERFFARPRDTSACSPS